MEHASPPGGLRVMNTRTHSLEPFVPVTPGLVRMYVCGPSVYDESHLGHARSYVAYDAMKRILIEKGSRVIHVQNFTDVEEHIAARARDAGLAPLAYADRMIARFFEDMDALHVLRADHYPRVSENIGRIQEIVQALEKKGYAYRADCGPRTHMSTGGCDVYFDVDAREDYGALIGTSVEELAVELPAHTGERRHPLDFALWKSRDDWGVAWDSPWGRGRPGWHVECTAMATLHLGEDFDIHGGGLDLVFPHHENERIIGEALTGRRYCNHYLHNGFVTVGKEKMSKSLGNFVTVRDLLARHEAEVIRTFLLGAHYRSALNYDEDSIRAAQARVERWRSRLALLRAAEGQATPGAFPDRVAAARVAFWAALDNDFHFGEALDVIDRVLEEAPSATEAAAVLAFLREAARALGILWDLGESP